MFKRDVHPLQRQGWKIGAGGCVLKNVKKLKGDQGESDNKTGCNEEKKTEATVVRSV